MIVKSTWTRAIIIVAIASTISGNMFLDHTTTTESSSDYLRKVMLELRDMNLPPPSQHSPDRSTGSIYFDVDDRNFLAGKRHSSSKRIQQVSTSQKNFSPQPSMIQSIVNKIEPVTVDEVVAETAMNNQYYQLPEGAAILPSSQKVMTPEVPSITKAELNAVYKHAFERGNAVSLNALADVLRHRQLAPVTPNKVEMGDSQTMYTYYFYPLKSFMNDVRHGNALVPAMDLKPETTGLAEVSQKDMSNPLFMAISGFIGMAMLFMIGILFLPRLGDFRSRVDNDKKFLDLTNTVNEAIDRYNCTDNFSHKTFNGRYRIPCQSVKLPTPKPSSVVLLTRKSVLQKEAAKRRRKISRKCKIAPCKKKS